MSDPVVHITNGVPDSGTGNITTLGQHLSAIQTVGTAPFAKVTDGTNTAAVKAASTAPVATDPALVVAISPNTQNANGSATDANSTPVAWSTEGKAQVGSLTETAPASDTASSGLNGRLQRVAQRITSLIALLPASLGANGGLKIEGVASGTAVPVSIASVPSHAVTNAGTFAVQATEADGANVTLGAKADAKSTATDTTAITIMSVLKQISASVQAAAASLAG